MLRYGRRLIRGGRKGRPGFGRRFGGSLTENPVTKMEQEDR